MQTSLLPVNLGNVLYNEIGVDIAFTQLQFSKLPGAVRKLCNRNNEIFLGLFADKITCLFDNSTYTLGNSYLLLCIPVLKADATEEIIKKLSSGARLKACPHKVEEYKGEKYIPVEIIR